MIGLRWRTARRMGKRRLTSRTMPTTDGIMDSTYRETSRLSSGSEPVARGSAQGHISLAHCAVCGPGSLLDDSLEVFCCERTSHTLFR